jgi:hypothetical protein
VFLEVWQGKELWTRLLDVWQRKELKEAKEARIVLRLLLGRMEMDALRSRLLLTHPLRHVKCVLSGDSNDPWKRVEKRSNGEIGKAKKETLFHKQLFSEPSSSGSAPLWFSSTYDRCFPRVFGTSGQPRFHLSGNPTYRDLSLFHEKTGKLKAV